MEADVHPIPDNWTPLEHVVISKCLDEAGVVRITHDATPGLNTWEAIGMVIACEDIMRRALADNTDEQSDGGGA